LSAVIFEDEHWPEFAPLSIVRHISELRWGTKTLLDAVRDGLPEVKRIVLWGRGFLGDVTKERLGVEYNEKTERDEGVVLLINARARPTQSLRAILASKKHDQFAAVCRNELVAARTRVSSSLSPGELSTKKQIAIAKPLDTLELGEDHLFQGIWSMVESNGMAIAEQGSCGPIYRPNANELVFSGPPSNIRIHETATVDGLVSIDARLGPVVVDQDATVESFSMLSGPCYIGRRARLRSALVRSGTSVFENCRIGGEVENSIIMPFTNKSHYGYVGDSVVGEWVNLGAGSTFSNLKNTYGNVRIQTMRGRTIDTGMAKFGPVIGDMAKVSIGAMVYAGISVGTGSHVVGYVRQSVPPFTYFDGESMRWVELRLDSIFETQRRMMERRGMNLSKREEALVRFVFNTTAEERRKASVKRAEI
jgi:UDP-N-acetylglucosamine diphosphorylase/glucosamine-1-phosphate N-acetyltransferase